MSARDRQRGRARTGRGPCDRPALRRRTLHDGVRPRPDHRRSPHFRPRRPWAPWTWSERESGRNALSSVRPGPQTREVKPGPEGPSRPDADDTPTHHPSDRSTSDTVPIRTPDPGPLPGLTPVSVRCPRASRPVPFHPRWMTVRGSLPVIGGRLGVRCRTHGRRETHRQGRDPDQGPGPTES